MARILIIAGVVMAAIGLVFLAAGHVPFLGKLPGDIVIKRKNFTLYFPLATSILLSVILTLILWLLGRR